MQKNTKKTIGSVALSREELKALNAGMLEKASMRTLRRVFVLLEADRQRDIETE